MPGEADHRRFGEGGKAYIAMECVEGETLGARMAREPLSHSEVLRFALQLADALAHAHERGVVHRDLKPANVIITPEQRLKVLDFGLARRVDERSSDSLSSTDIMITRQGVICGTPAYMSPEQLRGSTADERSDIWAFGVILHEMLSRERPFEGRTCPELSAAILSRESGGRGRPRYGRRGRLRSGGRPLRGGINAKR